MENFETLKRVATFGGCCQKLPYSTPQLARLGYEFNQRTRLITCSCCGFKVEDLKSNLDFIISLHKIQSPYCSHSKSETLVDLSELDEQECFSTDSVDSGYESKFEYEGRSTDWRKYDHKINIANFNLKALLAKKPNSMLKRTVEAIWARRERTEKLRIYDTRRNENSGQYVTALGSSASSRNTTTTFANPTDTEILQKSKHPGLAYAGERRKTFNGQEHKYGHMVTAVDNFMIQQFVDAGFYYTGPNDNVRCFFCDGGLVNFRGDDDPWTEHQRWYGDCLYVKYRKFGNINSLPFEPARALDSREIKARLETPLIQILLRLGYQREHLRRALERRLTSVGDDFKSVEELVEDILKAEGDSALPKPRPSWATARAAGAQNSASQPPNLSQGSTDNSHASQSSTEPDTVVEPVFFRHRNSGNNAAKVYGASSLATGNVDGVDATDRTSVKLESEVMDDPEAGTTIAATGAAVQVAWDTVSAGSFINLGAV